MAEKRSVLIVDDQTDIVEMVKSVLVSEGYYVVSARDDQEGVKKLEQINPHLILLDINMPNLAGINFYHSICDPKDAKPKYPVLVLTARANMESLFKNLSVDGFMAKPFDINVLVKEVSNIISKRYGIAVPAFSGVKQKEKKVLIVESDTNAYDHCVIAFANAGFKVIAAKTGVAGFERAVADDVHLALINLDLPDFPGDILAAKLKQMPKTSRIPVLLYSSGGAGKDYTIPNRLCEKIGVSEVIETNQPHILLQQVEKILNSRAA